MTAKPQSRRIPTLDVLRGFAVLGILLANIPLFANPLLKEAILYVTQPLQGLDFTIDQWQTALVTGKFRGLLCLLFGAGMWLQHKKLTESGQRWEQVYTRRMGILFILGCIHGMFIWWGDILAIYALTALISFWLARYDTATLWKVIGGLAVFTLVSGVGFMFMPGGDPEALKGDDPATQWMRQALVGEETAYASGTYALQFVYRSVLFILSLLSAILLAPVLAMLYLLGIVLTREGLLRQPSANPQLRNRLLLVSGSAGLPLNGAALLIQDPALLFRYQYMIELFGGAFLGVFYLLLISMAMEKNFVQYLMRPLQNVGRVALTTYLLQSLICTYLFYSWGLGWFGQMDRAQLLGVVAGVWIFNLLFAAVYLRFFDIGPFEWLWRSWAEKRKLPWKEVPAPAPPPVLPRA